MSATPCPRCDGHGSLEPSDLSGDKLLCPECLGTCLGIPLCDLCREDDAVTTVNGKDLCAWCRDELADAPSAAFRDPFDRAIALCLEREAEDLAERPTWPAPSVCDTQPCRSQEEGAA